MAPDFVPFPKISRFSRGAVVTEKRTRAPLTMEQKDKARERWRRWAAANREKLNANVRAYRARRYQAEGNWRDEGQKARDLKAWMLDLKSKPCTDCGASFATCCMDFDHRVGETKHYNLGSMFAHHYSRELIEFELSKCDLVCANCHRIRTRDRKKGSGRNAT